MNLLVNVHFPNGDVEQGILKYTDKGPSITLPSGEILESSSSSGDISYSFSGNISQRINQIHLDYGSKISLKSKLATRKYSLDSSSQFEMYPPSSYAWFTHISETGTDALFNVQEIKNNSKLLLTIIDIHSTSLLAMHVVNPYEVEILFRDTDFIFYKKLFEEKIYAERNIVNEYLETKPPKWSNLEIISNDVIIPNLKIGATMRETLEQFVPLSFPEEIRYQLMAFLSWLMKARIPNEDPLDFIFQLQSAPLFRFLVFEHIKYLLEGIDPPQYVRIINMAEKGQLSSGIQPVTEETEKNVWNAIWFELQEKFPGPQDKANDIARRLNQTGEIATSIPISKKEARASRSAWVDRFSSILHSLAIGGHVQNKTIGLQDLVYVGSAHRWPHQHLSWSARLGNPYVKAPYIQVMVMPPSAVERAIRARPNLSPIDWSASALNFGLFNSCANNWNLRISLMTKAMLGKRTLRQLENEFDVKLKSPVSSINSDEAKVLDLLTVRMYLSGLELGRYKPYLPGTIEDLRTLIESLRDRRIVNIQYFYRLSGLAS